LPSARHIKIDLARKLRLGEATPRAPQGPEATAARTSASCVDDVDDDQGVAVVEIEAVA
jgi:hypothetical protein